MTLRYRSRDFTAKTVQPIGKYFFRSSLTGEVAGNTPHSELVGHGWKETTMDELHGRPPYRDGGPFFRVRHDSIDAVAGACSIHGTQQASGSGLNAIHREVKRSSRPGETWRRVYEGGVVIRPPVRFSAPKVSGPEDYQPGINDDNLAHLGSRAYNRLRPKPEKQNLLQSLVEIRETLKAVKPQAYSYRNSWESIRSEFRGLDDLSLDWQRRSRKRLLSRMAPKKAADRFLGVQLGWKPFVSDVVALLDTTINYDNYLQSAIERNGKWLQRRFSENELNSSDEVYATSSQGLSVSSYSSPSFGPNYLTSASLRVYHETVTRVWYEGSFRYYYPEFEKIPPHLLGAVVQLKRRLQLHGLRISPSYIYRVLPWTWLGDWFLNVGDLLTIAEDQMTERVVSRYMYLMRQTITRYRYVLQWTTVDGQSLSFTMFDGVDCKRRAEQENYWSFSAAPGGLTPLQLSILAALGIGRT